MNRGIRALSAGCVLAGILTGGCTVARVDAEPGPARLESDGLIEGHAAVGIRADDDVFRLKVLDGTSDGAVGELVLWKLFRVEVGLLGASVGVGPFDLALGLGFYEPELPDFQSGEQAAPTDEADCALCAQARSRDAGQR